MNFKEAYKKLQSIVEDEYNCVGYKITTTVSGEMTQECHIYVNPRIWVDAATWDLAFLELDKILHPENHIPEPIEVDNISEIEGE